MTWRKTRMFGETKFHSFSRLKYYKLSVESCFVEMILFIGTIQWFDVTVIEMLTERRLNASSLF